MVDYQARKSKTSVPRYTYFLSDPEGCTDRWIARSKLIEKIESLKSERREIKKRPTAVLDLKKNLKSSWDNYFFELVANAQKFIIHNRNSENPFQNLQQRADRVRLNNYLPFQVIELALDKIAENDSPDTISEAERNRLYTAVEKKLTALKKKLAAVSPPGDFELELGKVNGDKIGVFITYWRNLQYWTAGPVGPQGLHLKYSPEIVQQMYYRLKLDKIRNPKARLLPAEP